MPFGIIHRIPLNDRQRTRWPRRNQIPPKPSPKQCSQLEIPNLLKLWKRIRPSGNKEKINHLKFYAEIIDFTANFVSENTTLDRIIIEFQIAAQRILLSAALTAREPRLREKALELYTSDYMSLSNPKLNYCTLHDIINKSPRDLRARALSVWKKLVGPAWTNSATTITKNPR